MAQHDYVIANGTGAATRADLNNGLAAIVSNNSGATEPATMYAYQWWADTTTGLLKIRNAANNAWVTVGTLASANLGLLTSESTLTAALGSASTPGITFTGDPNTGIYSPGADQVAISTNGTGRLFVDASGNVNVTKNSSGLASTGFTAYQDGRVDIVKASGTPLFINRTGNDGELISFYQDTVSEGGIKVSGSNFEYSAYNSGSLIFSTASTERARIDSSGRLLVGTSTSLDADALVQAYKSSGSTKFLIDSDSLANTEVANYEVRGGARVASFGVFKHSGITNPCPYIFLEEEDGGDAAYWTDNSGNFRISSDVNHIGTTSGTVVGTQTSDERVKNILGPVTYGLDEIKQLDPISYALKSDPEQTPHLGFIAQQVNPIIPESVFDTDEVIEEGEPTKLGMEYVALIPVLVNAIKELSVEVDALKAQLQVQ